MRNGTNRRTPLMWAQVLALALFVALIGVGCGGKAAQPDEGAAAPEPIEATEGQTEAGENEPGPDVDEADSGTAETEGDATDVEADPVAEEAASEVEAEEVDVEDVGDLERSAPSEASADDLALPEDGTYTSKDEVAWYLHTYGHLPNNYVTKSEAQDAGWKTRGLTVAEACPGKSIGGDRFGNYEGLLPDEKGRVWYECDIDFDGGRKRNGKRIVYSNDGLIYYSDDHYGSFERLY